MEPFILNMFAWKVSIYRFEYRFILPVKLFTQWLLFIMDTILFTIYRNELLANILLCVVSIFYGLPLVIDIWTFNVLNFMSIAIN